MSYTRQQIDYASVAVKLSAMLGRKWGVEIAFGGHPATNGETIILPHWNFQDPALRNALYGLIAHEAGGHVRQTDFGLLALRVQKKKKQPSFYNWKSCENILEDIRIEANLMRLYPGAAMYLNAAVEYMLCKDGVELETSSYWALALNWCLLTFRHECLKQSAIREQAEFIDREFQKHVSGKVMADARSIAIAAASLPETQGSYATVLDLADNLFDLLDKARPSRQPHPQQAQGDQTDQNGGEDAQGDQTGQNGGEDAQGDQTSQNGGEDAQGDQTGQNGGEDAQGDQTGQNGGEDAQGDQTGINENDLASEIGNVFGDLAKAGAVSPNDAAAQMPILSAAGVGSASPDVVMSNGILRNCLKSAQSMRQGLTAALMPMLCGDMEYSAHKTEGNRLDARRIVRALSEASPSVFRKVLIEDDQSVAIQILFDRSGSTSGSCITQEVIAVIGLASALETYPNVETAISYFPSSTAGAPHLKGAPVLKRFGQTMAQATIFPWPDSSGGTPLADAYQAAAINFLLAQKERKILIVLTDGQPDDPASASRALEDLNAMGIEVYGIVISDQPYPSGMFDESVKITFASELPKTLAALVRKII